MTGRAELLAPLANAQIFISGGTGFLGTWLLELIAVLNARHKFNTRVTVYSRSAPDFVRRHKHLAVRKEFHFLEGDICHQIGRAHV